MDIKKFDLKKRIGVSFFCLSFAFFVNSLFMKKLVIFILILCCLCGTMFVKTQTNPLFLHKDVESVCFASATNYEKENLDVESVACGDVFFNYCSLSTARQNLQKLKKNATCIQFYLADSDIIDLLGELKCQNITESQFDNICLYSGYSPFCQSAVFVDGKKTNVQIAVSNDEIVIGFPVILTGY